MRNLRLFKILCALPHHTLNNKKELKPDRKRRLDFSHLDQCVTSAIFLDTSTTKHTTLSPGCMRENVGGGGRSTSRTGRLWFRSEESVITSQVLRRLHIRFWRFGASWLWVLALQNSTTWKRTKHPFQTRQTSQSLRQQVKEWQSQPKERSCAFFSQEWQQVSKQPLTPFAWNNSTLRSWKQSPVIVCLHCENRADCVYIP